MAEYVKKEEIEQKIQDGLKNLVLGHDAIEILGMIYEMPSADVAPVRHGLWIASHDEFCACSICKYPVYVGWNQTNYCPNCGAKMDLEG